ncbi:hypothetical protein [Ancylobacter rudongensis]|uniref:Uncharacterized protein n=1 Tax=Ancylobacter rudongensis TaxID=177413 RepID=A0A1G4PPT7_9HYPH|nr:hypothetical protein [Ancylobacter rudongensis]SCW34287.1 hypothetical protein SAMN05660859_0697 [Ancylobacter rudongensis]
MGTHVRERESLVPEYVWIERRRLRQRAERTIEELIELLDELDGESDLEDNGDDGPIDDDEGEEDPAEIGIGDLDGLLEQYPGGWNGGAI